MQHVEPEPQHPSIRFGPLCQKWNFGSPSGFRDLLYWSKIPEEAPGAEVFQGRNHTSGPFQTILGTPLWHLSRLRLAEGIPLEIESSYFLADRFPGIDRYDFVHDSLYRVFEEEYGIIPTQGDETITATRAGAEAALLAIPDEAPIFRIESRTYDQYGQFLEYCRAVARPDRVQLISHMDRISGEEGGL